MRVTKFTIIFVLILTSCTKTEPFCSDHNIDSTVVSVLAHNIEGEYHSAKLDLRVKPIEDKSENIAAQMVQSKKYFCQANIEIVYDPSKTVHSISPESYTVSLQSLKSLKEYDSVQGSAINHFTQGDKNGDLTVTVIY